MDNDPGRAGRAEVSSECTQKAEASPVCERFLAAIAERDFTRVASCLASDVRFRALLPRGLKEANGVDEPVRCFQGWFGLAERVELLEGSVASIADRRHLSWRLRVYEAAAVKLVEQQAYATVRDGRIAELDLLCSGFRREPHADPPVAVPRHLPFPVAVRLDGGEAGCATLTPLVKERLRGMASGEVLEVATREPTAGQDLAAWCALTGHALVESRTDGGEKQFYLRKK